MKKERLTELLHLIAMGRRDAVDELADMLTAKPEAKTPEPAVTKPKGR